jgi:hypothetical protein
MKKENFRNDSKSKQENPEEQKIADDNLKFMRSVVEKTHKEIDPEAPVMIVWGLVCMIGYTAIYFLVMHQLYKWIWPVFLPLLAIGACVTIVSGIRLSKRQKKAGLVPQLSKQIGWVWIIVLAHGVVWSMLGLFFDFFGGPGFLWAIVYSIALSVIGIIYSREWLFGGIGIFVGMVVAFIIKDYAYLILGIAMGLGCIIPAIIAQRNYHKQEKENA